VMWGRSSLEKRQPWAGNPRGEIAREPCWDRRAYPSTSTPPGHSRGRRSTPTAECGRTGKRGGEPGDDNPALPGPWRHYQRPEEDRYNYPEEYLRARIVGALGGRGAEEIAYGSRTTDAENDIEQATDIARRIVTRWDMSDELDKVALAPRESPFLGNGAGGSSWGGAKPYSEETAQKIDAEVERIIRECHERARRLLAEHRGELDALARALLERETLDESEILAVTGLTRVPRLEDGKQTVSHAPDANRERWDSG
jgi:hypothetical protein